MRAGAIVFLTLALAACVFWMRVSAQSPDPDFQFPWRTPQLQATTLGRGCTEENDSLTAQRSCFGRPELRALW